MAGTRLEIRQEKAKHGQAGSVEHISFGLDVKCFFGTITAVLKHDGVVEGGTGTLHDEK